MSQNNLPKLIGITGFKRSGKDTCGAYLIKNHDYIKYSFAGALKVACSEIFMFDYEQTEGSKKEDFDSRWNINPRKVFQRFGTEIFRDSLDKFFPEMKHLKNNFWIYRFKIWYQEQVKQNPNVRIVVSDVRFQNEADIIKELGGIIIKVSRKNIKNTDNHISELNILNIKADYNIKNDSSLEDYYENLKSILNL